MHQVWDCFMILRLAVVGSMMVFTAACSRGGRSAVVFDSGTEASALQRELDSIFDHQDFSTAHWGVRVETLDGRILYDRSGSRSFTPASTMKLFTTAAALDLLGPDFTWETRVDIVGEITPDGVLDGHLVIVGSGDPSLGAWHPEDHCDSACLLPQWVEAVKATGIREIRGSIVGDGRCFPEEYYSGEWDYVDLPYWYAAGSSGLAMEENCFRTQIKPGPGVGDSAVISWNPDTSYITVLNDVETVEAGGTSNADIVWRETEGNLIRYDRTIAIDKEAINERGSVWDGPRYAAHLFLEQLEAEGVSVSGGALNILGVEDLSGIDGVSQRRTIASYSSPSLAETCKVINKVSHNFFADMTLRTLALEKEGRGDFRTGAKVIEDWLARIGAPDPGAVGIQDGSGLARMNFVQPRQMTHLLRYMKSSDSPAGTAFLNSMSIAGVDGWMAGRLGDEITKGRLRAKTGYIGHVRTLGGYVTAANGEELVFSLMCNLYTVPTRRVSSAQDAACLALAGFAG